MALLDQIQGYFGMEEIASRQAAQVGGETGHFTRLKWVLALCKRFRLFIWFGLALLGLLKETVWQTFEQNADKPI
jgi:hypothetical protein